MDFQSLSLVGYSYYLNEEDIWLALCCIVGKYGLDENPRLMTVQMNISSILYTVWVCHILSVVFC